MNNNNNDVTKKYGLFTAITMIVGICIGSGIFFKSDNVLIATNGSIALGVLSFILAAISIIFGCLTIGELASRTDKVGGLISYAEMFLTRKVACAMGWFQTFVYYPTITSVVAWVIGVYINILFNLQASLEFEILIGYIFLLLCFVYNILLPKFGAFIQNSTTLIKLLPLFILGILGIIFGDPINGLANTSINTQSGTGWISALGPIAYSFDGWIVTTSISHELKDAKKNMPKALMLGPLIVLSIYVLYFIGISCYVTPEVVMTLGDRHVSLAAQNLFGPAFSKMIIIFIVISVIGTVNGLVIGYIRMPYSLSLRKNMFPFSKHLRKIDKRFQMPLNSAICSLIICTIWMFVHYLCTKYNLLYNSDVSEGAIGISYIFYTLLYIRVFKMYLDKEIKSKFKGLVCPILATIGSLIILSGGIQNKLFIFYIIFCILLFLYSLYYYQKNNH